VARFFEYMMGDRSKANACDSAHVQKNRKLQNFETVDTRFRMIAEWSVPVCIVHDQDSRKVLDAARASEVGSIRLSRATWQGIQEHTVNISAKDKLSLDAHIVTVADTDFLIADSHVYNDEFGLTLPRK
jgi:hypothetical protein